MFRGYCATLRYFELRDVHLQSRNQVYMYAYDVDDNKQYEDIDDVVKRVFPNAKFVHNLSVWEGDFIIGSLKWWRVVSS